MSITYDNSRMDADPGTNITTSTSSNFTVTGTTVTLVVTVFGQDAGGNFPTSVKWGGVSGTPMTLAKNQRTTFSVSMWYIDNLTTSTNTVYVSYGANTQARIGIGMLSLNGCTSPSLGAVSGNGATTSTPSLSLTTVASNSVIVNSINYNDNTSASTSTGTNQTQRFNTTILSNHMTAGSTQTTTTAGTYTSSYSLTGSFATDMASIEIKSSVVFTRTPADSVMNGASRLTTLSATSLYIRAVADTIMNAASRFAVLSRVQIRNLSDSIMNAASRFVALVKGYLTTWTKETPPPTTIWTKEQ